jgi:phosphoglycolate phosphatase-like HAD superfamily hydrolase
MSLVLFDIDGTLVDCAGQARGPFEAALTAVFGTAGGIRGYDFSGKTDARIVIDLMTAAGRAEAEVIAALPRVREHYVEALASRLDATRVRLLPAVGETLAALAARADVALGLLTGNWRGGAALKLGTHDLGRYFAFGAFGDDRIDRLELPPVALERARASCGRSFAPTEVLIVGDSVLDVVCARAHGIRCLAVATGWTPAERLAAAGADRVVASLESDDLFELVAASAAGAGRGR